MGLYARGAELYDIAFSWNVDVEVDWLVGRWGDGCRRVLEPGCGSGRMFPALAARGISVAGIDSAPAMIERARQRMAALGLPPPELMCADMADFELAELFDAAVCPINTFGYLRTRAEALRHLRCVARHLVPGGRYLVQVDLHDLGDYRSAPAGARVSWEMERDGVRVQTSWFGTSFDASTGLETQVSRLEVLSGSDSETRFDDEHAIRLWDWESWADLIEESPFTQAAAFDGNCDEYRQLALGRDLKGTALVWHELVVPR